MDSLPLPFWFSQNSLYPMNDRGTNYKTSTKGTITQPNKKTTESAKKRLCYETRLKKKKTNFYHILRHFVSSSFEKINALGE